MKYFIKTYGCQMNVADSGGMEKGLLARGWERGESVDGAGLVVVNTCSVREHAESKAMSFVGELVERRQKGEDFRIIVAGCMAERMKDTLKKRFPLVDLVVGAKDIKRFAKLIENIPGVIPADKKSEVSEPSGISAFVTIMRGCENFCSYCIVPYVRGPEVSRPADEIIEEITARAANGAKEVTLLGQNVNSYHGKSANGTTTFPELLEKINAISGIERIRFMTSHPKDAGDELIKAVTRLPKVCEHVHLPLQSGSDKILAAMNRGYTLAGYSKVVNALRAACPDVSITTDILIGFPGETQEDFEQTLRAVNDIQFDFIFAFKYSPRPGTAAAAKPDDVARDVKEKRHAAILSSLNGIATQKNATLLHTEQEVLVEEKRAGQWVGRTRTNKKVFFESVLVLTGKTVLVGIKRTKINSLYGTFIKIAG